MHYNMFMHFMTIFKDISVNGRILTLILLLQMVNIKLNTLLIIYYTEKPLIKKEYIDALEMKSTSL
jgi:hypothetical protein